MGRLKWVVLLLLLPFFAKADDTAALNALLAAGNVILPGGHAPYSVSSSLSVTHNFNLNGNIINFTGIGTELKVSAGVTVQGGTLSGSGGSTAFNQSAIQPLTGASGITVIGMTIQNFGQYGLSSTNNSALSITNCTFRNIGFIAISDITNTGTNTGINISGNTIDQSMQPVSVPQPALIVRNFAPGVQTGTTVAGNTITMPHNPLVPAAECMEARGVVNSQVHDNILTGGSIAISAVLGCTNIKVFNNTCSGQSYEALECGDNIGANFHNNTITSGKIGILFDGGSLCTLDTLSNTSMSGLTGVPIQLFSAFVHGITIKKVVASTTTFAILIQNGAYNATVDSSAFTGNSTTYAIKMDNATGQFYPTNSSFTNFLPKIIITTASSATTVNNIVGTVVTPTGGTFLAVQAGTNVTLGPNISFNALPAHPVPAYSPTSYSNYINTLLPTITPTNSGGTATSWSITPTQPAGINFNTATGVFTGTPLALTTTTTYTVSASNIGGTGTTPIVFTIINNPPIISYTPNTRTATINLAITPMSPNNTGGAVLNYTISPALPAGLNFNTTTGIISGTPTVLLASTVFTITGFNSGGNSPTTVTLSVVNPAPAIPVISYSPSTNIYPVNSAITPKVPSNSGGLPTSYAISPALATGLSFDTATGIISGTPTVVSGVTAYDVSATNVSGTGHFTVTLSVINILPAPPNIVYTPNNITLQQNTTAILLLPSNTGGTAVSYSINPALPTGLSLNTVTGLISGTPTILSPAVNYTITGTNTGGAGTALLTITVVTISPGVLIRVAGAIAILE